MDLYDLEEKQICINLFLIAFAKLFSEDDIYHSLGNILTSLEISENKISYIDDGLSEIFIDFLICFDCFLISPKRIICEILNLLDDLEPSTTN